MKFVKINDHDNVAVLTENLPKGTVLFEGLKLLQDTPQSHKIALQDISKGGEIIRYDVLLGYAKDAIKKDNGLTNSC